MTNALVNASTMFALKKSISNVLLVGVPSRPVPGALIIYKLTYSNIGSLNGDNVLVYDRLPRNTSFFTEGIHTATGWTFEYSTNTLPDQNYLSINYLPGYPSDKSTIKWIRWKKKFCGTERERPVPGV